MTKPKQLKKNSQKYWENFFRNYAPFYIQGVGIFTEITVHCFPCLHFLYNGMYANI